MNLLALQLQSLANNDDDGDEAKDTEKKIEQ